MTVYLHVIPLLKTLENCEFNAWAYLLAGNGKRSAKIGRPRRAAVTGTRFEGGLDFWRYVLLAHLSVVGL